MGYGKKFVKFPNKYSEQQVGIGTSTPACELDVYHASESRLRVRRGSIYTELAQNSSGGVMTLDKADGNAGIQLQAYGASFFLNAVGIGSNADTNKFDDASNGSGSTTMYIGNESITTSSDKRIKKNIVDTKSNGLEVVNKFRVVDFNWDDPSDQCINNRNARGTWTGFLAQEAVEVAPYSVNAPRPEGKEIDMDSELTWNMNYEQLVPILAKAIQELSAKVEALENA